MILFGYKSLMINFLTIHKYNKYFDYLASIVIVAANFIIFDKYFNINNNFEIFIFNYLIVAICLTWQFIFKKNFIVFRFNPIFIYAFTLSFFIALGDIPLINKFRGILLTMLCLLILINIENDRLYELILKYSFFTILITGVISRYIDYGFDSNNGGILSPDFKINLSFSIVCYMCLLYIKRNYFWAAIIFIITLLFITRTSLLVIVYFLILDKFSINSRKIKIINIAMILIFAIYPWYLSTLPFDYIEKLGHISTFRTYFQQILTAESDFSPFRFETSYSYNLLSKSLLDEQLVIDVLGNNFLYNFLYKGQCPHNTFLEYTLDYGVASFLLYLILFFRRENRYQSMCIGMYLLVSGLQCEMETGPFIVPFFILYILLGSAELRSLTSNRELALSNLLNSDFSQKNK